MGGLGTRRGRGTPAGRTAPGPDRTARAEGGDRGRGPGGSGLQRLSRTGPTGFSQRCPVFWGDGAGAGHWRSLRAQIRTGRRWTRGAKRRQPGLRGTHARRSDFPSAGPTSGSAGNCARSPEARSGRGLRSPGRGPLVRARIRPLRGAAGLGGVDLRSP